MATKGTRGEKCKCSKIASPPFSVRWKEKEKQTKYSILPILPTQARVNLVPYTNCLTKTTSMRCMRRSLPRIGFPENPFDAAPFRQR